MKARTRNLTVNDHGKRWQLASKNPSTGRTEKFICPGCQRKRFRRYWDNWKWCWCEDTSAGLCDREEGCGYHKFPDRDGTKPPTVEQRPEPPVAPITPLYDIYTRTMQYQGGNTLKTWFYRIFGHTVTDSVWAAYGAVPLDGQTVAFWQFDAEGRPITASSIRYGDNGHRDKTCSSYWWAHNELKKQGYRPPKHLFGLLLALGSDAKIAVVESPKSALLCECARQTVGFLRDWRFVATGGASMLNATLGNDLQHLKWDNVYLFPDSDAAGRGWIDKAKYHFGIGVVDMAHEKAVETHRGGTGYDIGDYVEEMLGAVW